MPYGIRAQLCHGQFHGVPQLREFPVLLDPYAGTVPGFSDGAVGIEYG